MHSDFSFAGKSILVVDDQRPFQLMIRGMLTSLDAEQVSIAHNGENAIVKCTKEKFDIIFIDYNLGSGRNGRQLFEELKAKELVTEACLNILVTGESQSSMVVGALEIEPDDYIIKPFSQNLLLQRVARAWLRRQTFQPYYKCLTNKEYESALQEVEGILSFHPRYKSICLKYKADLLLKLERFDQLQTFLTECLNEKRTNWVLLVNAQLLQHLGKHHEAIKSAKEAVLKNKLTMPAYDLIADNYLALGDLEQAYLWVKQGIDRSPFSVSRQYKLSTVAKLNNDFETSIKACSQVVDLTSHSFKKDYQHVLNHIRNIIDICELEPDEQKKRKYNQEVIHALQKSKRDSNQFTEFSQEDFETMCLARLDSVNGMTYRAKQSFSELSTKYESNNCTFPTQLLADSILLLLKIGDFDKAFEYSVTIKNSEVKLDSFTNDMIHTAQSKAENSIKNVKMLNQKGINEFKDGNFDMAMELFEQSLKIAPMNTGSALNLIQVLLAKIEQKPNNKYSLLEKCKNAFRVIEGMPIGEAHRKRAQELHAKMEKLNT